MAGDSNWSSVTLLMNMIDPQLSDGAGKTVTKYGNTTRSATQSKFGGYSAYFDGAGDYLSVPSSSDFDFGSGDFTIECWVYQTSRPGIQSLISRWATTSGLNFSWRLLILADGTPAFQYGYGNNSVGATATATAAIPLNTWTHVAAACSSGTIRVFIDGAVVELHTRLGTLTTSSSAVNVGRNEEAGVWYLAGYLNDVRITKGLARYTADFTVPSERLTPYKNYVSGTLTETSDHTEFTVRTYRLDSGLFLSETTVAGLDYQVGCCPIGTKNDYAGPVMAAAWPNMGTRWAAGTAYTSGDYTFPTAAGTTPYIYKCTTAGTSHSTTEPTWGTTPGGTTSDGTVTWTCQGRMLQPIMHGPLIPSG